MDELTLRLSELETQNEELEKQLGRLTVQQERTEALLQKTIAALDLLNGEQREFRAVQEEQQAILRTVQRHLDQLTERAAGIDRTADMLEDRLDRLTELTEELSRDMDGLYEDMNVLSKETRARTLKLKEEVQRYLWDSEESRYDNEGDTMW